MQLKAHSKLLIRTDASKLNERFAVDLSRYAMLVCYVYAM